MSAGLTRFLVLAVVVLAAAVLNSPTRAATPSEFIAKLGDDAVQMLGSKELSDQQKVDQFRTLLTKGFDVALIGRLVLGRNWRTASDQERNEYTKLFEQFIVNSYASRLGRYGGESLKVKGARADDADFIVASDLIQPNGPPVKIEWRLRGKDPDYRVVDIIVEGVSMVITQRDEFAAVVQRCGGRLDCLFDRLRDKNFAAASGKK